jgi:uncharacterized protein involved in outer membrane biogenesis
MKKILKITGIVIVAIVILMLILPFAFKGKIIKLVKTEINKTLTADVDFQKVGLNLFTDFPYLSVNIHKVSVVGRETFTGDTLAYIEKLHLAVNLMSIFGDQGIEIRKINIHHPIANLLTDKEGKVNWDIMKPSDTLTNDTQTDTSSGTFKLLIKDVTVSQGNVMYDDQQGAIKFVADNLDFQLSGDLTADMVTLKTALKIENTTLSMSGLSYLRNAKVTFDGAIDADLVTWKYTLKDNKLKINELEFDFAGWVAMPTDDIDMDISLKAVQSDFKNFLSLIPTFYTKDFASIQTKGSLGFSVTAKGALTDNSYPAFDANLLIESAMFKYPDLPKPVDDIQLAAHIFSQGGDLDNMVVDVNKFHLKMGDNPFDMKLLLKKMLSNPTFDIIAKGNINLNTISEFYPLDQSMNLAGAISVDLNAKGDMKSIDNEKYDDVNITGLLSLSNGKFITTNFKDPVIINNLKLDFSQKYAHLTTDVKAGRNDIAADGRLENFIGYALRNDVVKGNLSVKSNYININDLMSSETSDVASDTTSAATSAIEIPSNINFALNVDIKQLIYDQFDLKQVVGALTLNDQTATLNNLSMKALDGTMQVSGSYVAKNKLHPAADMNVSINDVDIQQTASTFVTMKTLLPIIEHTTGRFTVDLKMKTTLDQTMSPDFNTLNATGKISSNGVKIENMEVLEKIADAVKMDKLRKITLNRFAFTFKCVDGKVITDPFDINAGNIKATISGSTVLDETINYVSKMQIPRSEFGASANDFLNNLSGNILGSGINVKLPDIIKFNLTIDGTFHNPKIGVSGMNDMGKDIVQQVVEQGKEIVNEQIDKALDEAKKQRDKLIAEAQKQKDEIVQQAQKAANAIVADADKQIQELVKKAGKNPIAKSAAEATGKKLKQEAQKKADDMVKEADKKGTKTIDDAKKKGDDLINEAEKKKL